MELYRTARNVRVGNPSNRGFTLIELTVALSVIAILTVIAVPSFAQLIATSRAKTTATDFYLSLTKARSSAAKFNAPVTISPIGGNWQSGWNIVYTNGSGTTSTIASESATAAGITIAQAPASVVYTSSGRAQAAASFEITSQVGRSKVLRCVKVDTAGHPYVKPSAC